MSIINVGYDASGNGNNWTPTNIDQNTSGTGADVLVDVPTPWGTDTGVGGEVRGNYCTWNPLFKSNPAGTRYTFSNGNLDLSTGYDEGVIGTIGVSSGKWYWEVTVNNGAEAAPGIVSNTAVASGDLTDGTVASGYDGFGGPAYGYYGGSGNKFTTGTSTSYGATFTSGDVVGIAFDADNWTLTFYKNGSSQGTAFTGITQDTYYPLYWNSNIISCSANFGQRPFAYAAPSGFAALCTTNLPDPTIADGGKYFNTVLYTGNGTSQSITGVGFQPDWLWLKTRSATGNHAVWDVVRGTNARLRPSSTSAEDTNAITSFDSDGFTLGTEQNTSATTYVAWNWKAGGSGVSNTDGSITSTVSANPTAGFSIVTYTGNGSTATGASAPTIGHGLGVAPQFIIVKARNVVESWPIYHVSLGASKYAFLNVTDAAYSGDYAWSYAPSSSVFSVTANGSSQTNGSGRNFVAYCFAPVEGYSAFGGYTANNSADGVFNYCGFRPRWLLIKCTSNANAWVLLDSERSPYNVVDLYLYANSSAAEATDPDIKVDFLSNGFKLRGASGDINYSTRTYIYAAFAENPFKYALAR